MFSCDKGKANFVLKGTISDVTFQKKLDGATISLYQIVVGTSEEIFVASQTIGSDGNYSFTFPRDNMEKYILRITKENYFPLEETIYFSSSSLNADNIKDYVTTAKSWVKLIFINDPNLVRKKIQKQIERRGL